MNINKDTKIYCSFSSNPGNNGCIFFNNEFEKQKINAIYKSFYSIDAKKLVESVKHLNFSGFALSMPLKIDIMNYLDIIDPAAQEIGAVNTVINNNGILSGYNTDWLGVIKYFEYFPHIDHLTILGDGGFSKAIQYACKKLFVDYNIIKRQNWKEIPNILSDELPSTINIIFNATPVDVVCDKLIDGRPFTEAGKNIANLQAKEQFYLYTGIRI